MDNNENPTTVTVRELRYKPRMMLRLDDAQYERLREVAYLEHMEMTQIVREGLALRIRQHDYNAKRRAKSQVASASNGQA
jgi:hypothetical protein